MDIQQKRATDAVGCIKYFLELNNADSKRSAVFTDPNKVHEVCSPLANLPPPLNLLSMLIAIA